MRAELDRELWDRIAAIFDRALDVPSAERPALLARLSGSDHTVRREVEEMLAAHERDEGLLAERRLLPADDRDPLAEGLPQGARVGPYQVESLIGAGGMGDVYRAERVDGAYRQTVALKVLRPGYRTAEMVRRFRIEREALARLTHPGIATILDGGALDDGRPYIVLELVDGPPITTYCDSHALSLRDRLTLFLRVASAVQFAHGRLVVHRDIKPSNILVQRDGRPRLLDFGIAKLLDLTSDTSLAVDTTPEVRLLTPEYAAPEQLRGEAPSTATDVYALGVLLFELLTGQKPFPATGRTPGELEQAVLTTPAPAPSDIVQSRMAARRLRGDLDRIVLMALRKEPDRRYLSAAQLGEDIERYLTGRPVIARPDSVRYRVTKFVARNQALVAGGLAVALLLVVIGVTATVQARRIARERDRAERERVAADDVVGILTRLFERADPNKHSGGDTLRVTGLLDEAEQEVEKLGDDPARQVRLWQAVGRMRAARGEFGRAKALLTRAYDRRRGLFGTGDLEAARIHHEIAVAVASYNGETAARAMLDSSLTELRRLLGEDHEDVRSAISDLLMATADSVVAGRLLGHLLDLERRSPSKDPVAIANRLDSRGGERYRAGHYSEAVALYQASLALLNRQLPPEHEYIRTERRNLALALSGQGLLGQADSVLRVALAAEDRIKSAEANRAMAREALAITLGQEGYADSAERYEREALALLRAGAGPENWRIWSAIRNLAFIVSARGRPEEGLALLDTAVAIARTGQDSTEAAGYLMAQRVPFELRLNRLAEAARSVTEAENRLGNSASVTRSHRADVNRYAGMVELAAGRPAAAVERFRKAVALVQPPEQARTAVQSCLMGVGFVGLGQLAEARPLLGEACSRYLARGLADPLIAEWIDTARKRAGVMTPTR